MALVSQKMNLDYIRTFVVLAQSKTMTEASEKLGVGTSYVSRHIRTLESELGVKLLKATPKNKEITLTEDGKFFYEKYEKIYHEILLTEKEFKQSNQLDNCKITIGINTELEEVYLKEKLLKFYEKYPNICVKIVNGSSEEIEKKLLQFSCDFIIDKEIPENRFKSQEITTKILEETYYFLVYSKEWKSNNFNDIPFILPVSDLKDRQVFNDYFKNNGLTPKIKLEVSNYDKSINYAINGIGIAIVLKELIPNNNDNLIINNLPIKSKICVSYIQEKLLPATKEFLKLFDVK